MTTPTNRKRTAPKSVPVTPAPKNKRIPARAAAEFLAGVEYAIRERIALRAAEGSPAELIALAGALRDFLEDHKEPYLRSGSVYAHFVAAFPYGLLGQWAPKEQRRLLMPYILDTILKAHPAQEALLKKFNALCEP